MKYEQELILLTGLIQDQPYHGVIDQLRTLKEPEQPIATFEQTVRNLLTNHWDQQLTLI